MKYVKYIAFTILLLLLILLTGGMGSQNFYLPLFAYVEQGQTKQTQLASLVYESLTGWLPLCSFGVEPADAEETAMHPQSQVVLHYTAGEDGEGSREETEETREQKAASGEIPADAQVMDAQTMQELLEQENGLGSFVPATKQVEYDWALLQDYETFLSTFYAIDSSALAGSDLFDLETLSGMNVTLEKKAQPQILIYHTHSLETYKDSRPGEQADTVVGVGALLAQILQEEYGYQVIHHTGEYDTVRDEAYAKSLPALEQLLKDNPSIEVVIDLHRDAANPNREMVTQINGKPTAKFMFFNGISRGRNTGEIDYLYNENRLENLAFSFQMQRAAGEYYPGLTRKIYIKNYRYNMHLKGRSLLIELGDESNTVEEAKNACYPLAHLLDLVLSGTE